MNNTDAFATFTCSKCGAVVQISDALQRQLAEQAEVKAGQVVASRERALAVKEASLGAREGAVALAETQVEARVAERLAVERLALEEALRVKARSGVELELRDLRAAASESERRLQKT